MMGLIKVATFARTTGGDGSPFSITVALLLGSTSNAYLFALIMDQLTLHIKTEVPWCEVFANDIVQVDDTREGLASRIEKWREALEFKYFKISRTKST